MDHRAAEPATKGKPFNAEERSKQKKDEEKRSTANREHLRNKKSKAIDVSELHSSLEKRGK